MLNRGAPRNLGVDHLGLLSSHRPDMLIDHNEIGGVLDALLNGGKIRAKRMSNFRSYDRKLLHAAKKTLPVFSQTEDSLGKSIRLSNGECCRQRA